MQDGDIINSIRSGGGEKRTAAKHIFVSHQSMMTTIRSKLNLTSEDIKDMYADAVSAVIWNIDTNKFKGESKISSYLYRILYNKSVDLIRHKTTNKNEAYLELSDSSDLLIKEDQERILETNLDIEKVKDEIFQMGQPCNNIIIEWAYWGYSMTEIAERNGLESADKAKKKKYYCLKNLKTLLNSKKLI